MPPLYHGADVPCADDGRIRYNPSMADPTPRPVPDELQVRRWFDELSSWGRWGPDDERGTLNHVTPGHRAAAAALVTEGETVSCAWDIDVLPRPDLTAGAPHRFMLSTGEGLTDPERVGGPVEAGGTAEYIGMVFHGYAITHVDGLSHMSWANRMYNGVPASAVTAQGGATRLAVTGLADGLVTRGVLLDVAGLRDVPWLEPGEGVLPEDLEAAASAQGVPVGAGDVVLLRTGYGRKVREQGPDPVGEVGRAGWHAACLPWLHDRRVAAIGADTAQDVMPSGYSMRHPVHHIGIVAMGLWLIDNCDLEPLVATCRRLDRWSFLFTLAPLRVVGGTGSPVNPLATF
jgi:kynurenine formamidase